MHWHVIKLGEVSSTMDAARELAEKGCPEGTVVVAERQTRGRGRFGRTWASPAGGLWFSVVLRPSLPHEDLSKLPLVGALAVARALKKAFGLKAELRWPNDVLIRGRKVCGVLVENSFLRGKVAFSIIGVGVNANFRAADLPGDLPERATTLMDELGKRVDLDRLLETILAELGACYEALLSGRGSELLRQAEALMGFPRPVRLALEGGEEVSGLAIGLAGDGSLLMELPDGSVRAFHWASATLLADEL